MTRGKLGQSGYQQRWSCSPVRSLMSAAIASLFLSGGLADQAMATGNPPIQDTEEKQLPSASAPALASATNETPGAAPPQLYSGSGSVGWPVTFGEVIIPAPEIVVKPVTDRAQPIFVRIDQSRRHGDSFRYDLTAIGLEAGEYNVADWLVAIDGQPHQNLPRLRLAVNSVLEPGPVPPSTPIDMTTGRIGYYLPALVAGGLLWLLGLVAILFSGRVREQRAGSGKVHLSMADRIRPVILRASQGQLDPAEGAELERTLTSFWKHRLRLEHLPPDRLLKELRGHPEAGPLLEQLEFWLHSPSSPIVPDLEKLLRPYLVFSADEV